MADIVNDRVNEAQALLKKRADKLESLIKKTKGKKVPKQFSEGMKLVADLISNEAQLIDKMVFDVPTNALEQMRNLQLVTGGMNETPTEHLKSMTGTIDGMLEILEDMTR
ncbi:MAG: hypothetical protein J6W79_01165 [Alphaproteobacteria bacterium]|nr:hypothetical protein [Alphaproteobacteria bacterium]